MFFPMSLLLHRYIYNLNRFIIYVGTLQSVQLFAFNNFTFNNPALPLHYLCGIIVCLKTMLLCKSPLYDDACSYTTNLILWSTPKYSCNIYIYIYPINRYLIHICNNWDQNCFQLLRLRATDIIINLGGRTACHLHFQISGIFFLCFNKTKTRPTTSNHP